MISNKGMYERFVSRCFSEPFQSRMEGFASQCGCGEEYNFRAGFFCALHLEEIKACAEESKHDLQIDKREVVK
jgi:hypothetical protein